MSARDHRDTLESEGTLSPFGLIWDVMTSPLTFMVSSSFLGVLVALGTYVLQGSTEEALLAERTFAGTRSMMGLGFHHLSDSWLVWLFVLLVVLNVIGMALRYLPRDSKAQGRWQGLGVDRTTWRDEGSIEALKERLEARFSRVNRRSNALVVRRGYWSEGLLVICLGLICLLASLLVDKQSGMEALIPVVGGGANSPEDGASTLAVKVLEDGTWIERQLPFSARCNPTALIDPKRGWRCVLKQTQPSSADEPDALQEAEIALGPKWPDDAFGMTFHVAKERPLPPSKELLQIADVRGSKGRLVYSGPSGRRANLESGQSLTAFKGPNGPLVVVTPDEGRPYLLGPTRDLNQGAASLAEGSQLVALSPWSLTIRASRRPGKSLVWTGFALLMLGLLVLLIAPHGCLVVSPDEEGVLLKAWSFNRPDGAQKLRALCGDEGLKEKGA